MRKILIAAIVSAFCASAALAQTTTPPPAASKTTPKVKVPEKPHSAESLECSKQADTQGLHGKKRKTFREKCMKDMKKKT